MVQLFNKNLESGVPAKLEDGQSRHSESSITSEDENKERGNWTGKLDFILSCLSYAVGLGNLWRFPYLCYRNGGGAFLIPYVVMLVFAGIPMFFMELAFGQFASEGVISIWKVSPLFQGIGWAMFLVSSFIAMYYNMIIAWTIFYFFASLNKDVPWRDCGNEWNTPACGLFDLATMKNCTSNNGSWSVTNHTCIMPGDVSAELFAQLKNASDALDLKTYLKNNIKSPSNEYFHNYVLDISDGFHDMGHVRWQLALCLALAWVLVGASLIKGIKSQGKVVYFTATFPYLVLSILLVRGLTLPGAVDGVLYYVTPQWERLGKAKVWGDAAVQIFFSLAPCWGGLITLASYNKFHNNCMRDTFIVSIGNCLTSFFAGFVIFAIIGFMAHEMSLDIDLVAEPGAGLAFIVYPEVVSRLPISPLWAVMFFLMLITLGLGTQFSTVVTVHTTVIDMFPSVMRQGHRSSYVMVGICIVGYILGLSCCTRGGMFMLQLMDNYAATYSLLIIGIFEVLVISYVYGVENFMRDIGMMLGHKPSMWWKIMWCFVTPGLLMFIIVFTWIDYTPSTYGDYQFPVWADALGWMCTFTSICAIPVVMVYKICTAEKEETWFLTIKKLSKPTSEWGPALEINRDMKIHKIEATIPLNMTPATPVKRFETEANIEAEEKEQLTVINEEAI